MKNKNKTIIVELFGGLGNQMFQYAAAKNISEKLKLKLYFDISFFDNQDKRNYNLNIFSIKETALAQTEINRAKGYIYRASQYLTKKNKIQILKKVGIILKIIDKLTNKQYINEKRYFNLNSKQTIILSDYFQSEIYFTEISDTIKESFRLKSELLNENLEKMKKIIQKNQSVSIHVRRGDYVTESKTNKYHGVLPIEYYEKAVNMINDKVNNPIFYIFSDDINWCKNNLNSLINNAVFIENQKDYEDLELMKNCKHNIIANSSFSWWGAWLNENPQKIVVAPKKWLVNKNKYINDQLLKTWLKI